MTICLQLDGSKNCLGSQDEGQAVRWNRLVATISLCHFESQWEKKRRPFDRWNSNSCQLRLWLKIIPLWVRHFFWLNHNFKVKWFHYVQLQLWLSVGNQAGGDQTNTLRAAAFVCGYNCLQAGFLGTRPPQSISSHQYRKGIFPEV